MESTKVPVKLARVSQSAHPVRYACSRLVTEDATLCASSASIFDKAAFSNTVSGSNV